MVKLQITVTEDQLKEVIKDLVMEIDYDVWKRYENPESEGDPDWYYLYEYLLANLRNPVSEYEYAETEEVDYGDGEPYEYVWTDGTEERSQALG